MPPSAIANLRDLIDAPSLKPDEQRVLITKLKTFLEDDVTANDARLLLKRVREREDLLAWTEREIARLLGGRLAIKGRVKKSHIPLEPRTFSGHTEAVFSVAYSPSGRYILTGSVDKTARLWDAATGKEVRQFTGHTGGVVSVAFSPDGSTILTGSLDSTARIWEVSSGKELQQFGGHIAFSVTYPPDGCFVLTGSADKTAWVWDSTTGQEQRQFIGHADAVTSVAYAPDGRTALTGSADKTARLWNVRL